MGGTLLMLGGWHEEYVYLDFYVILLLHKVYFYEFLCKQRCIQSKAIDVVSVADPGCLSRIQIFSIPDPHQWI